MPGFLLWYRMPTVWCSRPKSALKPSAKVRCCFKRRSGHQEQEPCRCGS